MADNANNPEKKAKNPRQSGGGRRRNNRRRGNKPKPKKYYSGDKVYECPICGQNVRDVLTAIAYGDEKSPAHFDCVLKKIAGQEALKNKEKVIYLGKGEFGIVKFKGNSSNKFEIVKRIPLEPRQDGPVSWRKDISRQLKR